MTNNTQGKIIFSLSLPLTVLIIIISCFGIFTTGYYSNETFNWATQSIGQDIIDLFLLCPLLLITSYLSYKNNGIARLIWAGIILYLVYTFIIYCFSLHFNSLFLIYCFCLGLSLYSFLYFLFSQNQKPMKKRITQKAPIKIIGIYFIIIGTIFYLLWLSEIVPAMVSNSRPQILIDTGLLTNPVHILDLSVILPAFILTGIFLLKKKQMGFLMTTPILIFSILMNITIGFLSIFMNLNGLGSGFQVVIIMSVFTIISFILLILYLKNIGISDNKNFIFE